MTIVKSKDRSLYDRAFTMLVVLGPILNSYKFLNLPFSITEFLLIGFVLASIFQRNTINNFGLLIFGAYFLVQSLFLNLISRNSEFSDLLVKILRDSMYLVVVLVLCPNHFIAVDGAKWYLKIARCASVFLFIQVILHYTIHWNIPNLIPGLQLFYAIPNQSDYYASFNSIFRYTYRPSSFFLEPSYLAQYFAPALLIALFAEKYEITTTKKNMTTAIMLSVSCLLSTSATGLVFVLSIWIMWFLSNKSKLEKWKFYFGVVILLALLAAMFTPIAQKVFHRMSYIGKVNTGENSASARLLRGLIIYNEIPIYNQIFGTGLGLLDDVILSHNIFTPYDGTSHSIIYMNTFSYVLNCFGIVGLALYCYSVWLYRKQNIMSYRFLIIFLMMFVANYIYSSPDYLLILAFMSASDWRKREGKAVCENEKMSCNY